MPLVSATSHPGGGRSVPARSYAPLANGYVPRHDVSRNPPTHVRSVDGAQVALTPREVDELLDTLDDYASMMEARWIFQLGVWPLRKRIQFGVDTVVGMIPGVGDIFLAAGHLYVNARGRTLGLPRWKRAALAANSVLDTVVGLIPLVGGAWNAYFCANRRNVNIILRHFGRAPGTAASLDAATNADEQAPQAPPLQSAPPAVAAAPPPLLLLPPPPPPEGVRCRRCPSPPP